MLRLELKDIDDTVLFVNPQNGIEIRKIADRFFTDEKEKFGIRFAVATCGSCELMQPVCWYRDPESRNTAYEYVLSKVNEYLFPKIDPVIG